jgi:hypothetical protein
VPQVVAAEETTGAEGGNRTRTSLTGQGILSILSRNCAILVLFEILWNCLKDTRLMANSCPALLVGIFGNFEAFFPKFKPSEEGIA